MHRFNSSLRVLFAYNSIFLFAAMLLGPLFAFYVSEVGGSILTVSAAWAVFLGSTTIFMYFVSKYGYRVKHKRDLLAAGYLVRFIGWAAYIFVGNVTGLIIVQMILGLGEAFGTPAFDYIFAEHINRKNGMMEYTNWELLSRFVMVVATVVGGLVASKFGFTPLFITMSAMAFIAFLGVISQPREILG